MSTIEGMSSFSKDVVVVVVVVVVIVVGVGVGIYVLRIHAMLEYNTL